MSFQCVSVFRGKHFREILSTSNIFVKAERPEEPDQFGINILEIRSSR